MEDPSVWRSGPDGTTTVDPELLKTPRLPVQIGHPGRPETILSDAEAGDLAAALEGRIGSRGGLDDHGRVCTAAVVWSEGEGLVERVGPVRDGHRDWPIEHARCFQGGNATERGL